MGPKKLGSKIFGGLFCGSKMLFVFCLVLGRLQEGPRGSKRRPRGPRKPSRAPQEAPKGSQKRPRRLQEGLQRPQEPVKRAQNPSKSSQEPPKTPTRLFRSSWSGSGFRKNEKIESIRPQGFSEALGPAVVFGKMEKFKAWLQKASKTLKIADIDESQRPCHNSQNEKRRAGGGDPPWGSQSAATRRVGACLDSFSKLSSNSSKSKSSARPRAFRQKPAGLSELAPGSVQNRSKNLSKF